MILFESQILVFSSPSPSNFQDMHPKGKGKGKEPPLSRAVQAVTT
jgi:hypothetical protein